MMDAVETVVVGSQSRRMANNTALGGIILLITAFIAAVAMGIAYTALQRSKASGGPQPEDIELAMAARTSAERQLEHRRKERTRQRRSGPSALV